MNSNWIPARVGDALMDVDTPALILDLDRFEANLGRLMSAVKGHNVSVRPHAKSHKCVEIARRQVAAGAIGICCQKTSEAEPFLAGGIVDVLITNEVVGERKTMQLAQLAARYPQLEGRGMRRRIARCRTIGARVRQSARHTRRLHRARCRP